MLCSSVIDSVPEAGQVLRVSSREDKSPDDTIHMVLQMRSLCPGEFKTHLPQPVSTAGTTLRPQVPRLSGQCPFSKFKRHVDITSDRRALLSLPAPWQVPQEPPGGSGELRVRQEGIFRWQNSKVIKEEGSPGDKE